MRELRMHHNDLEDISGKMPKVKNSARKARCKHDLARYLRTYHPATFCVPFSPSHESMLARLQGAMMGGSAWMLETAFRGFGKTSLAEGAAMWALNYGHRQYLAIIGPDEAHAAKVSGSIQMEYESNDILLEDFPEICWPIRALQGKFQRCATQTFRGKRTFVEWNAKALVFPTIKRSKAAGSIIQVRGYKGRIRGMRHKRPDGVVLRPDFAIFEDPQTEGTAKSTTKTDDLLEILVNAITGLTGHESRISVVVPATIIKKGDAIDQLASDKQRFGAWMHNNTPMMHKMPTNMKLWLEDYAEARHGFDPEVAGDQERAHKAANEIYQSRQAEMDEGATAAWDECYDNTEISAVQHAMNILIDRGEAYFASECQGAPIDRRNEGILEITEDVVAGRVNGLPRLQAPAQCQYCTGFIDVGFNRLHWLLCGWDSQFCGHIAAYGEYPADGSPLFDDRIVGVNQGVAEGVQRCIQRMLSLNLTKDDGEAMPVDRIMIDCGEPSTRSEIFGLSRGHRFGCPVLPSRGRAHHKFRMPSDKKKRGFVNAYLDVWKSLGRVIIHDACVWRERVQRGIMAPEGSPGAIRIWGGRDERHSTLAQHLCSEKLLEKLVGETGEVYKWMRVPGLQNHLLDCLTGCAVCASVEGLKPAAVKLPGQANERKTRRRRRGGFRAID